MTDDADMDAAEDRIRNAAKWAGLTLSRIQGYTRPKYRVRCMVHATRFINPADPDGGDVFTLDQAERFIAEAASRADMLGFDQLPARSRRA